jgi:hypothetical protein
MQRHDNRINGGRDGFSASMHSRKKRRQNDWSKHVHGDMARPLGFGWPVLMLNPARVWIGKS